MHNGLSGENYDDYITQGVLRTGRGIAHCRVDLQLVILRRGFSCESLTLGCADLNRMLKFVDSYWALECWKWGGQGRPPVQGF